MKILPNDKQYSNEKSKNEDDKTEIADGKVKFFTEIKQSTRDLIDDIKEREENTIGNIIDKSVQTYKNFRSLPPEIIGILDKYEEDYGSKIKEVEEAIKLLDQKKNIEKSEDIDLWIRARDELAMMLIGKTTFNQLIAAAEAPEERLDKPFKRNVALDVILWYTGKPIKTLLLNEILNAIQKMWVVANYFYIIDLKQESEDQYHLMFKHHQTKRYSNYWLGYFSELFNSEDLSFKCAIEGESYDETLSLTIKNLHDK